MGRARERRVIRMVKSAFLGYVSVFLEGIHFQTGKIPLPYRALRVNLATHIGKMRVATANEPGNAREEAEPLPQRRDTCAPRASSTDRAPRRRQLAAASRSAQRSSSECTSELHSA